MKSMWSFPDRPRQRVFNNYSGLVLQTLSNTEISNRWIDIARGKMNTRLTFNFLTFADFKGNIIPNFHPVLHISSWNHKLNCHDERSSVFYLFLHNCFSFLAVLWPVNRKNVSSQRVYLYFPLLRETPNTESYFRSNLILMSNSFHQKVKAPAFFFVYKTCLWHPLFYFRF